MILVQSFRSESKRTLFALFPIFLRRVLSERRRTWRTSIS